MADEHHRHAELGLQILQQINHLRLNGHIQRRYGLIADDQLGPIDHGARNAHTLVLTARQLMRIAIDQLLIQADFFHHFGHPQLAFTAGQTGLEGAKRFGNRRRDGHARVQ